MHPKLDSHYTFFLKGEGLSGNAREVKRISSGKRLNPLTLEREVFSFLGGSLRRELFEDRDGTHSIRTQILATTPEKDSKSSNARRKVRKPAL
jgi:hypothetical protein